MQLRPAPLIEDARLERPLAAARMVGAILTLGLGPLFPNVGMPFVVGLAVGLVVWSVVVGRLFARARTRPEREHIAQFGFVIDSGFVVYTMWLFAADPGWTTWTIGTLLIIGSAFRFGRWGGMISAGLLAVAYLAILVFRQNTYGFAIEPQRATFHMSVYLLCALLMTGAMRELYALREQREYQAFHDTITSLPNRALLIDRLGQAVDAARATHSHVALLILDLRGFKAVNATFGHDTGNLLLHEVGRRLHDEVRAIDTVARLGGDEFAVLLPETDRAGAVRAAEQILKAFERPFIVADQALDIGGSIGVVVAPDDGVDADSLLARADIAMYAAKDTLDGHVLYAASLDQHGATGLALLSDLRRGLDGGELVLHYQPLLSLLNGRTVAVEALARWQHPRRGLLGPSEFIPLAERSGLIKQLTMAVLAESLRQLEVWATAGLIVPIAVNLSVRSLLDPHFSETVARLLDRSRANPDLLRFEITESVLMVDPEVALRCLAALRKLGLRLSLDDFGTGYSSLAYLNRLPLDEIKIDRSFVATMSLTQASQTIIRATIDLGHGLGYEVVAEGVEDQPTQDRLAQLGCDILQGFHIARPLPAADLASWMELQPIGSALALAT
ncbi:MAG: EAL domain-containing protein [Chloroflexota bacterium]